MTTDLPEDPAAQFNPLAVECHKRARDACGTAEILETRATTAKRRLQMLTFIGLAVPLFIGLLVIAYGFSSSVRDTLIGIGSGVLVLQGAISLWALVAKWDNSCADSTRSAMANRRLFQAFERLLIDTPSDEVEFRRQVDLLVAEDNAVRDADYARGEWSEAERRLGARAAYFRLNKPCPKCGDVPRTLTCDSDCGVCGGYKKSRFGAPRLQRTH
jgi:mobilome CxxCx(11)CxxC protein